jgi:hypothetical protein
MLVNNNPPTSYFAQKLLLVTKFGSELLLLIFRHLHIIAPYFAVHFNRAKKNANPFQQPVIIF